MYLGFPRFVPFALQLPALKQWAGQGLWLGVGVAGVAGGDKKGEKNMGNDRFISDKAISGIYSWKRCGVYKIS